MQYRWCGFALLACGVCSGGCGDDGATTSEGAGGGASSTATSASSSSASASSGGEGGSGDATSSASSIASASSGTPECASEGVLSDPALDACAAASCCAEAELCASDRDLCFIPGTGAYDLELDDARALRDCVRASGCDPSLCDAGIGFGDDPGGLASCLAGACCDELYTCTLGGEATEACIACIEAGPPYGDLCAPVEACAVAECDGTLEDFGSGQGGAGEGGAGGA